MFISKPTAVLVALRATLGSSLQFSEERQSILQSIGYQAPTQPAEMIREINRSLLKSDQFAPTIGKHGFFIFEPNCRFLEAAYVSEKYENSLLGKYTIRISINTNSVTFRNKYDFEMGHVFEPSQAILATHPLIELLFDTMVRMGWIQTKYITDGWGHEFIPASFRRFDPERDMYEDDELLERYIIENPLYVETPPRIVVNVFGHESAGDPEIINFIETRVIKSIDRLMEMESTIYNTALGTTQEELKDRLRALLDRMRKYYGEETHPTCINRYGRVQASFGQVPTLRFDCRDLLFYGETKIVFVRDDIFFEDEKGDRHDLSTLPIPRILPLMSVLPEEIDTKHQLEREDYSLSPVMIRGPIDHPQLLMSPEEFLQRLRALFSKSDGNMVRNALEDFLRRLRILQIPVTFDQQHRELRIHFPEDKKIKRLDALDLVIDIQSISQIEMCVELREKGTNRSIHVDIRTLPFFHFYPMMVELLYYAYPIGFLDENRPEPLERVGQMIFNYMRASILNEGGNWQQFLNEFGEFYRSQPGNPNLYFYIVNDESEKRLDISHEGETELEMNPRMVALTVYRAFLERYRQQASHIARLILLKKGWLKPSIDHIENFLNREIEKGNDEVKIGDFSTIRLDTDFCGFTILPQAIHIRRKPLGDDILVYSRYDDGKCWLRELDPETNLHIANVVLGVEKEITEP